MSTIILFCGLLLVVALLVVGGYAIEVIAIAITTPFAKLIGATPKKVPSFRSYFLSLPLSIFKKK